MKPESSRLDSGFVVNGNGFLARLSHVVVGAPIPREAAWSSDFLPRWVQLLRRAKSNDVRS
jgi:hypothetical protein